MKKFHEYLSSKGNVQATGDVRVVADKVDVPSGRAKQPPKEAGRPKNSQPYSVDGKKVMRGGSKGFGDHGDRDLMYDVTKKTKAASLPTAESFAHHQVFPQVRNIIASNPQLVENLIREFQRKGLLGVLVGEMLSHNETYGHIAQVMASKNYGYSVCRKLAKAMREDIAPPFHQSGHHNELDPMAGSGDPNGLGTDPLMGGDQGHDDSTGFEDDDFDDLGDGSDLEELPGSDDFHDDDDDDMGGDFDEPTDDFDDPADPQIDPATGQPIQQQIDPATGQPIQQPPAPPMPPAMENMRRAWRTVNEGYRPLTKTKSSRRK